MESSGASKIPKIDEAEDAETTIEIKVKTLDSQTYTLRVDKQMPIPALKAQIASVTGVLSERQRLICRGKVLKDDQLLSAYHVEDGHTLHLVVRPPVPLSGEGVSSQTASDPSSVVNHSSGTHISPGIFIETIRSPEQGDGVPPEIGRIVSAVLGSFGITNLGSSTEGRSERYSAGDSILNSTQQQSDYAGFRGPSSTFGLPTAISVGQPPVIPDSLTTMSQYISHLRGEFDNFGRGIEHVSQSAGSSSIGGGDPNIVSQTTAVRDGLPTPASLAELVLSTRQLLTEQVGESLQLFVRQLENQENYSNPSTLSSTQNNAMRIGILLHYLGAYILELGRTAMTLRLGQSPTESVVNAGPAIYISPLGPNPLMVQPLPLQMGTSIGNIPVGTVQTSSGVGGGIGTGFLPRRIDIQIRRVPNANREGHGDRHQPLSAPRNIAVDSTASGNPVVQPSSRAAEDQTQTFVGESGIRVVPVHTMVAAVPTAFGQTPSNSLSDSPSVRVQTSIPRTANSTPSAGEPQNQESGRQVHGNVYHILRSMFSGGEIHVEEESTIGAGTISDHTELGTPRNPSAYPREAEATPTVDELFLSNLLHRIMPMISQHVDSADTSSENDPNDQAGGSSGAGTTRRQPSDTDMDPPNSKRQKRE